MPDLFTPMHLGDIAIPNRVLMAPLTRCRAGAGFAPTALNAQYYAQRAGSGLLISEATCIEPRAHGYPSVPGIYTPQQVAGWRLVTDAVHAAGGRIVCQLWHVGRVSHSAYQPGGAPTVSSAAVAKASAVRLPDGSRVPADTPRALTTAEVRDVIEHYRQAARLAKEAGFDGVEMHGANSYLPEQFLRDGLNTRTDEWGGSLENRARFHLEAVKACVDVWGAGRVGVRLSPSGAYADLSESDPRRTYGYLVERLDELGLAYLHIMEAWVGDEAKTRRELPWWEPIPVSYFRGLAKRTPIVVNSGFTFEKATNYLREGWADAVAFGRLYIANPDLAERFRAGGASAPLNTPDESTFYTAGEKGYTDYPRMAEG
jgi:N-ethylmaleimide reductase